uniref:Uncharacterized protein n=1 Tax=Anguilla anguilla TaxID=7936 RepID=A0A0E9TSU6_ANGAN
MTIFFCGGTLTQPQITN